MSNVFSFTGAVGRDAEVKYLPSGAAILNVNVANNVGYGDKQQTMWIRVALFGKRAEGSLKDYLVKGQQVFCSGELRTNEYQANDGTTKTSLEMVANIIDLVGKKGDNSGQSQPAPQSAHHAQKSDGYAPSANAPQAADNFGDDYIDDIPF